ncbi:MAG: hypothetical protein WDN06_22275 [Asticcacaulis sp.]
MNTGAFLYRWRHRHRPSERQRYLYQPADHQPDIGPLYVVGQYGPRLRQWYRGGSGFDRHRRHHRRRRQQHPVRQFRRRCDRRRRQRRHPDRGRQQRYGVLRFGHGRGDGVRCCCRISIRTPFPPAAIISTASRT